MVRFHPGSCLEIHLCCCLALWLCVDVTQQGSAGPEPGVHHSPNRRLLPWDAVVVIMLREVLIVPPHRLFCPDRPKDIGASEKIFLLLLLHNQYHNFYNLNQGFSESIRNQPIPCIMKTMCYTIIMLIIIIKFFSDINSNNNDKKIWVLKWIQSDRKTSPHPKVIYCI